MRFFALVLCLVCLVAPAIADQPFYTAPDATHLHTTLNLVERGAIVAGFAKVNDAVAPLQTARAAGLGGASSVQASTASTVAASTIVLMNDSADSPVVTLPSAAVTVAGTVRIVKDMGHATSHNVTVSGEGGETIDGAASKVVSADYGVVRMVAYNSKWWTW
jgi:hypothetical protein